MLSRTSISGVTGLCAILVGVAALTACAGPHERRNLGLFSTLPIYWGEVASIDDMLAPAEEPHWAKTSLAKEFDLVPLDALIAEGEDSGSLQQFGHLILAQPRALSAAENVALDNWVRRGGKVLIFADPMLTRHSRFSIGDRRRAQDVVMLSPILRRWGLELQFDDSEQEGERNSPIDGIAVPLNLAGSFALSAVSQDAPSQCALSADNVLAECRIGDGRAVILADAAVLEVHGQDENRLRAVALEKLVEKAFDSL
ncbi:Gldg family protein [Altererythrobacter aquiaggeris]|uniref:Gldg family protein n=1 Tax=Aestuarierythrobacter aquiaggeris TaxID=1898396 RepID=UPI003016ED47